MKKALIYGTGYGALVGIINSLISFSGVGFLSLISGVLILAGYIALLVILIRQAAQNNAGYGRRFLVGWVFSLVFGVLDGLISAIYTSFNLGEVRDQLVEVYNAYNVDVNVDQILPFLPVGTIFGVIIFNAIVGAFWAAIIAAVIKPNEEAPAVVASPEKEILANQAGVNDK
jgi:hypothetical protein